jgi:hypothetical protein
MLKRIKLKHHMFEGPMLNIPIAIIKQLLYNRYIHYVHIKEQFGIDINTNWVDDFHLWFVAFGINLTWILYCTLYLLPLKISHL